MKLEKQHKDLPHVVLDPAKFVVGAERPACSDESRRKACESGIRALGAEPGDLAGGWAQFHVVECAVAAIALLLGCAHANRAPGMVIWYETGPDSGRHRRLTSANASL